MRESCCGQPWPHLDRADYCLMTRTRLPWPLLSCGVLWSEWSVRHCLSVILSLFFITICSVYPLCLFSSCVYSEKSRHALRWVADVRCVRIVCCMSCLALQRPIGLWCHWWRCCWCSRLSWPASTSHAGWTRFPRWALCVGPRSATSGGETHDRAMCDLCVMGGHSLISCLLV